MKQNKKSLKQARIIEGFVNVKDAIRVFEKKTGYDLSSQLVDQIAEGEKADEEKAKEIKEQKDLLVKLEAQEKEVAEEIKKAKDEEIKEEFNSTLILIQQTIVETKNELDELLK